jgi:hypothetical protein
VLQASGWAPDCTSTCKHTYCLVNGSTLGLRETETPCLRVTKQAGWNGSLNKAHSEQQWVEKPLSRLQGRPQGLLAHTTG